MQNEIENLRGGTLVDVAVLDVLQTPGLHEELVAAYLKARPEAARWPAGATEHLRFRTECRWGRVDLGEDTVFLLNEKGDGPRESLGPERVCRISIYAEIGGGGVVPECVEPRPFIDVAFDAEQARRVPVLGYLRLEEFLLRRLEGVERAYLEWRRILEEAYAKLAAKRSPGLVAESAPRLPGTLDAHLRERRPAA